MPNTRRRPFTENLVPDPPTNVPIIAPYVQSLAASVVISVTTGVILTLAEIVTIAAYSKIGMVIIVTPPALLAVRNLLQLFIATRTDTALERLRAEYAQQTIRWRDSALQVDEVPAVTSSSRTIITNRRGPDNMEQIYRVNLREFALEIWRQGGVTSRDRYLSPGKHHRFTNGTLLDRRTYDRMREDLLRSGHAIKAPNGEWRLVSSPRVIRESIRSL